MHSHVRPQNCMPPAYKAVILFFVLHAGLNACGDHSASASAVCMDMQLATSVILTVFFENTHCACTSTVACKGLIECHLLIFISCKIYGRFFHFCMQPPRFGKQSGDQEEGDDTDEEEDPLDYRPLGITRRGKLQKLERELRKGQEEENRVQKKKKDSIQCTIAVTAAATTALMGTVMSVSLHASSALAYKEHAQD